MSDTITIEGSRRPCGFLARGERAEVTRTPHIDRLIAQGFVDVIDTETNTPEPPELPKPLPAPKRNASREDWAEYLAEHTDVVTEGKDRDELIAAYDEWLTTHDAPSASGEDDPE